jgi:hypothetical protein
MSVVLVATHQHVMTDKKTNVMILSGTKNTKRRLVNVTLSPYTRFCYVMLSVILTAWAGTRVLISKVILQVETGSAITWKYPSVILKGDDSIGEFYSVALTNNAQQADTGTKMVHIGARTRSKIVSKGISAGRSRNVYRGLVQVQPAAEGARNFSQCDSMLIGDNAAANTYPYIQVGAATV